MSPYVLVYKDHIFAALIHPPFKQIYEWGNIVYDRDTHRDSYDGASCSRGKLTSLVILPLPLDDEVTYIVVVQ